MKFEACIEYTLDQAREAKRFNDEKISGQRLIFTFKDLFGFYRNIGGNTIFFPPSFTARELIIPWLQLGNIPELIDENS